MSFHIQLKAEYLIPRLLNISCQNKQLYALLTVNKIHIPFSYSLRSVHYIIYLTLCQFMSNLVPFADPLTWAIIHPHASYITSLTPHKGLTCVNSDQWA